MKCIIFFRLHQGLSPKGVNILKSEKPTILEQVLTNFCLQIILADLLKACDIVPNKIFGVNNGLSLGIVVCAYFDEAITFKEAIECAFAIAFAANSVSKNDGSDSKELSVLVSKSGTVGKQSLM